MTDSFAAEVEAEEVEARRQAIEQISPLFALRQDIAAYQAGARTLDPDASDYGRMGVLRRWLHDHAGEKLSDDEHGLIAYLQPGGTTLAYDTPLAIFNRAQSLFQRLFEVDAFVVDEKRVADCIKKGLLAEADIAPFRHVIARTPSLRIEKEEKE